MEAILLKFQLHFPASAASDVEGLQDAADGISQLSKGKHGSVIVWELIDSIITEEDGPQSPMENSSSRITKDMRPDGQEYFINSGLGLMHSLLLTEYGQSPEGLVTDRKEARRREGPGSTVVRRSRHTGPGRPGQAA
eukprot:747284-Hanusia_phi.AAC.2